MRPHSEHLWSRKHRIRSRKRVRRQMHKAGYRRLIGGIWIRMLPKEGRMMPILYLRKEVVAGAGIEPAGVSL